MFIKSPKDQPPLDKIIDRVIAEMETYGPEADEYPTMLAYLERLSRLKTQSRSARVSPDTKATILGNLFGILIIVAYEQKHVMTSKGLSFILKPK